MSTFDHQVSKREIIEMQIENTCLSFAFKWLSGCRKVYNLKIKLKLCS
jgi:hypothetical protein